MREKFVFSDLPTDVLSVCIIYMNDLDAFCFTLLCKEFYSLRSTQNRQIKIQDLICSKDITLKQYKLIRHFYMKKISLYRKMLDRPIFYLTKSLVLIKYFIAKSQKKEYKLDKSDIFKFTESLKITVKDAKYLLQKASDKYIDKEYLSKFISQKMRKKRVYYISYR